jgi:drug/metabolite transporter (DMT)-like permease
MKSPNHITTAIDEPRADLSSLGIPLWPITHAPIALAAALSETSVMFAMLIAIYYLGEQISPLRLPLALIVAAGAIAIKIS